MKLLFSACYTICIVALVAGAICALIVMWSASPDERLLKVIGSCAVLFVASSLTLGVAKAMYGMPRQGDNHKNRDQ